VTGGMAGALVAGGFLVAWLVVLVLFRLRARGGAAAHFLRGGIVAWLVFALFLAAFFGCYFAGSDAERGYGFVQRAGAPGIMALGAALSAMTVHAYWGGRPLKFLLVLLTKGREQAQASVEERWRRLQERRGRRLAATVLHVLLVMGTFAFIAWTDYRAKCLTQRTTGQAVEKAMRNGT